MTWVQKKLIEFKKIRVVTYGLQTRLVKVLMDWCVFTRLTPLQTLLINLWANSGGIEFFYFSKGKIYLLSVSLIAE